jgi:hypothetical protein
LDIGCKVITKHEDNKECMNAMDQRRKLQKNVFYMLPLRHAISRATNATPPTQMLHRLCAIVLA